MSKTGNAPLRPVSLVTGAGSGIGRATALALAARGHRLLLCGRSESALRETAHDLTPADVLIRAEDVTERGVAARLMDACVSRFGRLDALVNNAGTAHVSPVEATDASTLERIFAVNTFAVALLTACAWPIFKSQGRGVFVHISSLAAVDPFSGFFVYAASKAAVESLSRSAAREGLDFGIESYAIRPGAVETPLLRRLFDESVIPRRRTVEPAAIAEVVAQCISGERRRDNGGTIEVPTLDAGS